ncbi:oxidoreductase [Peniophora sp. CONT]|nr:oxidoreductase [Peniophora sp. CONT]
MHAALGQKVVLVTGCSEGGIGFALAEEFAARNCIVYGSARNVAKMASLAPAVHQIALDVTSDESIAGAVKLIMEEQGRIDILVNNAGVSRGGPLLDIPFEDIKNVYEANIFSIIRTVKAIAPDMCRRKQGLIINVGSIFGTFAPPWSSIYGSSKAAVHMLTNSLKMELSPFNVSVMLVAPGAVRTGIANHSASSWSLPENSVYAEYADSIRQGLTAVQRTKALTPEQFAKPVVDKALRRSPPYFVSFAPAAGLFKLFSWLPSAWVRWIFGRWYLRLSPKSKTA